jgi:hypothetical protein
MKNIRKKVRFCILSNLILLIIITIPIVILDTGESSYFRYGWSDDLILISFPVNTKMRYMIVCLYIIVIKASNVFISEIVGPILGFNIYNPDKIVITDFTKFELQVYGNANFMINGFKRIMTIMISITQIDLALIGMLSGEIMSFYTIRMLLNEKKFKTDTENNLDKMENEIDYKMCIV